MTKLKKITALVLALIMVLALAACGGSGSSAPTQEPQKQEEAPAAPETEAPAEAPPEEAPAEEAPAETVPQPEGFPSGTIDFVVAAPAGAGMDLNARALEQVVDLGTKSISITNIAGANNVLGTSEIVGRPADGYTIGTANLSAQICQPLRGNADYTMDDFRHIAYLQNPEQLALVANKDCGLKTFEDLVDALKAGDEVTFTCANAGAVAHLALLAICDQLELPVPTYVPFTGAELVGAVLGGQVDIAVTDVTMILSYCQSGEMTALLTITDEVCARMSDVPYGGEKGLTNMNFYTSPMWIVVKKDTPDDIVQWIKQQINAAVLSDGYQEYLSNSNLEPYTEVVSEEEITETLHGIQEAYADLYAKYF